MIIVSDKFRAFVNGFRTQGEAARYLGVKRPILCMYLNGQPVSTAFIARVTEGLRWEFKDAFRVVAGEKAGK